MGGSVRVVRFSRCIVRSQISLHRTMSGVQTYASIARVSEKGKENKKHDQGGSHNENGGSRGRQGNGPPSSKRSHSQSESQTHPRPKQQQHQPQDSNSQKFSSPTQNPKRGRTASPTTKPSGPYKASEYTRSPYHIPQTNTNRRSPSPNTDEEQHYILTLLTTEPLHKYMTTLRQKYFPPKINKLDAHVSLFHALSGSKLTTTVIPDIETLCAHESPFPISAEEPHSPRLTNILVRASSPHFAIEGVQKSLRTKWAPWLSQQDNGSFHPHWTILNKVEDKGEVERCLGEAKREFERVEGEVLGLVLWRYEKGWWKDRRVFEFGGGKGR